MKILKVYRTSKGVFLFERQAWKKSSRVKTYDEYLLENIREEPSVCFVLYDENSDTYFELKPIQIDETND